MRVALLSRSAHPLHPPGGLERAVYHLARHLQAKGVETVLFTRPATCAGEFPGRVVEVEYTSVHAGAHGRVLDRTLNYPRFSARVGRAVAQMVKAGDIDVVHAQGLTALGYGRLRHRDAALRAPLVMNPQGMEEHKTRGLKRLALTRLRALSREAACLSDRVIATDEATRAEVPLHLGVDASKVVVLPNGIDEDEIRQATPPNARQVANRAVPELAAADLVLLSVGRIERYKGFRDVARALGELQAGGSLPSHWIWVVAGEGPDVKTLRAASLGPHLRLLGRIDEPLLHALYERADVFIHAPHYEGSSLVTLEAMAHGLPVIATRAGGIEDKLEEGRTGRLVAPGDVAGLAAAIRELAAEAAPRRVLGQRGRERALRLFAWPALAERTIALYRQLLREARA